MLTNANLQFSAKLELALGFRQAGQGDRANGRRHVVQALALCPSLVSEIGQLIPDWAMQQTWESPMVLAHVWLDVLPDDIVRSGHLRQRVLSQIHVAQAFEEYRIGHHASAVQHCLSGLRHEPSLLKRRGVLAVLARSLLHYRPAEPKPTANSRDLDESIPDSIVSAIETTLKCAIDHAERITITQRRIYLVRAGEREYVLHIIEAGKDALERRLAITNRARAAGIPAPMLLVSSLTLPAADHDSNWFLEEKMPGSSFIPWNMSQAEQVEAVADLGQYLRQLHRVKVTGFGPLLSAQLEAPYRTFDAWLSSKQEAIAQACLQGVIPEALLPTLDMAYRLLQETYVEPPVLCHCELSHGNVLVTGGHVSALVDWDSAAGTDPAYDVAIFFATIGNYWYPMQDQSMLAAFVQAYRPDEPDNFYRRVIAHRLLFIAGAITWLMQYGDEQYRLLTSIMNDTSLLDSHPNVGALSASAQVYQS